MRISGRTIAASLVVITGGVLLGGGLSSAIDQPVTSGAGGGFVAQGVPTASATPNVTPTAEATPTATPEATPTATPQPTATATPEPTATATPTPDETTTTAATADTTTTVAPAVTTTTVGGAGAGAGTVTTIAGELPATGSVPYWSLVWLGLALAIPGVILTVLASRRPAAPDA